MNYLVAFRLHTFFPLIHIDTMPFGMLIFIVVIVYGNLSNNSYRNKKKGK